MKKIKRLFRSRTFRKRLAKTVLIIGILLISASILDAVLYNKSNNETMRADVNVLLPEKIYVVNEAAVEWINGSRSATEIFNEYRKYGRLDYTKPVEMIYTIENMPVNYKIENQHIAVFDKDGYKEVYSKDLSAEEQSITLENLRPSTTYEYFITINFSNDKSIIKNGEFTTEPSPCFLFVDGTRNVRDIGAVKTIDGRQIKKYMVYRGSELDGAVEPNYVLTEDGIRYMKNILNIKTEVDLRRYDDKKMKNMLGWDVAHNYYTVFSYDEIFEPQGMTDNFRKLFSDLANPDMYPAYVHCAYGADRTGTVIYLLQALLGVGEETLYKEWECSLLCHGDVYYNDMNMFVNRFKQLPGNTMQEKAENYLISIGVTTEEIESIREILLTD